MRIELPYGENRIAYDFPEETAVLRSRVDALRSERSGEALVREAMQSPVGSPPLAALAIGKRRAVIIISDHTRPVPSRDILPPMLEALREGNPAIEVTLLVATGFHRGTTERELMEKLGPELLQSERIVIHDARDPSSNVRIGTLPSGAPLVIDRVAAECDLLLSEGFIEPHFFAGFSGGRKSVLPGICDQATVLGNHCGAFIDDPRARTGVLEGNPIHRDMAAAARMAGLCYIVNVVIDENKRTVAAFAGDLEKAHAAGCDLLRQYCAVQAVPGDIVVSTNGGAPLDQNLYQCVKGLTAAEASAKPGAVLILCAACADGTGGEGFYRSLRDCESPAALYERFTATPQSETVPDQWESQMLARVLKAHRVIFIADPKVEKTVRDMKMEYARTLEEAIETARAEKGRNAAITVIPNGVSVIVEAK